MLKVIAETYRPRHHGDFLLNKKITSDWRNKCEMVKHTNSSPLSFIKWVLRQCGGVVSRFGS